MSLGRLKWLTIILPLIFVAAIQLCVILVLEPVLGSPAGHWLAFAIIAVGVIVFSSTAGTTGVGAVQPIAKFLVPIEANRSLGVNTGVAISNPTGSSVDVAITLLDADGKPVSGGTTLQSLPPNGQLARFASELFGSVDFSQFKGTILVNSPVPINGMAIRVSPGQFSTLPVAAVN